MNTRRRFDLGRIVPRLAVAIAITVIVTTSVWLLALRFADD